MLVGVDYSDFHFSLKGIRLTPLGCTCIGNSANTTTKWHWNQYTSTYFDSKDVELGNIGHSIREFWNVEDISNKVGKKIMSLEDKMAFKMVEKNIKHDVQQYEVAILCKKHPGTFLLNSYSDVVRRLHHIEKQLSKKTEVCKAYEQVINQYWYRDTSNR